MKSNKSILSVFLITISSAFVSAVCSEFDPVPLSEGTPLTNLSAAAGESLYFSIQGPGQNSDLILTASGGTGDVDMFVLEGRPPSRGNFDSANTTPDNNEEVRIIEPGSGLYYVLLYGFGEFSGVSLTANYATPLTVPVLTKDVPINNVAGPEGETQYFKFITDGSTSLAITTTGGTGDLDMFVKKGSLPTLSDADKFSFNQNNDEEIILFNASAGTYYIGLNGFVAYAGVTLTLSTAIVPEVTQVIDGTSLTALFAAAGTETYYAIDAPDDGSDISISTTGFGDLDLFVSRGTLPTPFEYELSSEGSSSNEQVIVRKPSPGEQYYILLYAYDGYFNVNFKTSYIEATPIPQLTDGVSASNIGGDAGTLTFYQIEVPPGQCSLTVTTTGGTGDLDLFVRRNAFPNEFISDEFSATDFNEERVVIPLPEAGTYNILLYAFDNFSGATLTASLNPDPDANPWANAITYPNGWSYLPWFGYFVQLEQGWIYHLEHGFQFYSGADSSSYVFYDMIAESWFWSSANTYPILYKYAPQEGWLLYHTGGQPNNRQFTPVPNGT